DKIFNVRMAEKLDDEVEPIMEDAEEEGIALDETTTKESKKGKMSKIIDNFLKNIFDGDGVE
ncbi:MAG: hypothetical protein RBR79_01215, partial [Bacteroidales bacterium]|nr:hypothetical protein [Bacteroidales bacterium]